ncbi:ATP-binding cassette domain-containing protein [Candidatus Poribacteria bacterium]|nr:ATP-binding cassette domain-containing protein [Candidatus Poribacteria bacterium]MYH79703.1 ATP-binding cassette domain-containing protein [Candidatus Poribacteria bacterium]MYK93696.1 ATP-binding cassette domain-containing protein [Candidatus Poribacteria bacterium]
MRDSMGGFDSGRSSRRRRSSSYSNGGGRLRKLDHEPLSTTEEVPELLKEQAEARLETGEEIKVSVSTDLRFDGTYGKDWLLVTNKRIIAFNQNGVLGHHLREVPLSAVEDVEILEMYGNNILKVSTADNAFEVSRYSKRLTPKFGRAVSELEQLIPETEVNSNGRPRGGRGRRGRGPGGMPFGEDKGRCEKCGHPIPSWSGVCVNCVQKGKLIFRLLKYAVPFLHVIVPAFIIMMIVRFIGAYPQILSRDLVDRIIVPAGHAVAAGQPIPVTDWGHLQGTVDFLGQWFGNMPVGGSFGHLIGIVLILAGVRVFGMAASAIRGYMMAWVGQNVTRCLQNETYEHLNALSIDFFHDRDTGNLMSRITHDVSRLRDFIANGIQEIVGDSLTIIFMCAIMFTINWQLALWTLIPIPCLIFFTIFFGKLMSKVYHVLWKRYANISTILASTIPGVRVVKAFARERYEISRFNESTYQVFTGEMNAARLGSLYRPIMEFIAYSGAIIIWLVGGWQIFQGAESLGTLIMFQGYMMQFFGPVRTLCQMNERFIRAGTSAERVFEIMDTPPSVADKNDAVALRNIRGAVEFRDVYFSYDNEKNALDGVSFTVEPGEMIGLVGHSGAGKSTLINLITRFYDPNDGKIIIDGYDSRDIQVKTLRQQIGVVLQDPFLFQGTIAENIGYSKPGASRKEIIAAARAANAHDFIVKFPDGYDTMVGERGARVSGGERQRISIARAILKNPRILILDEATSSVDTETESKIQEALERLIQGRTVFAIAHRLSTLKYADRLVVLKEGEVDEIGTHEELIAKEGTYANLCEKQTELSRIRAW